MPPPLEFHHEAAEEVSAAVAWYSTRSRDAATGFVFELDRALDAIASAPSRWPEHVHGTRRYLLRRYPFLIVYRATPDVIQIIAVAHARRKPGYWQQRTGDTPSV